MSLCDNCIHNKVCLHGGNITVCDDMIPNDALGKYIQKNNNDIKTWIKHTDNSGNSWYSCPSCEYIPRMLSNYCPKCGAKLNDAT